MYYYSATITDVADGTRTIEVRIDRTRPTSFTRCVESGQCVNIVTVCSAMRKKFEPCVVWSNSLFATSVDIPMVTITPSRATFNGVHAPRQWIDSILWAELDYHVGAQTCLRPSNAAYLRDYKKDVTAGWSGPYR